MNKNQDSKFENLVNENITAEVVLVIDENGQQLGEKSLDEALDLAEEAGYDLVCVAPNAKVPVCKFMDYRKFRYEQQKRARVAKKNQTVILVKEVRLTPVISDNDFETKLKAGVKFLEQGNKLKVTLKFVRRERMLNYGDPNIEVMNRYIERLQDIAVVESKPVLEGKNVTAMLAKKKAK
ncbi:MAG: translation initiation factor IF-3 [Bacilli bacterium]|nr:translation initiation factor IF-3 [Bacilli bacterium]